MSEQITTDDLRQEHAVDHAVAAPSPVTLDSSASTGPAATPRHRSRTATGPSCRRPPGRAADVLRPGGLPRPHRAARRTGASPRVDERGLAVHPGRRRGAGESSTDARPRASPCARSAPRRPAARPGRRAPATGWPPPPTPAPPAALAGHGPGRRRGGRAGARRRCAGTGGRSHGPRRRRRRGARRGRRRARPRRRRRPHAEHRRGRTSATAPT